MGGGFWKREAIKEWLADLGSVGVLQVESGKKDERSENRRKRSLSPRLVGPYLADASRLLLISSSSPTPSDEEAPPTKGNKKKKTRYPSSAVYFLFLIPCSLFLISDWYQRFLDMYYSMDPSKKLRLSTGTVVEDVIFTYASRLKKPTPAHAFIIDANNVELGLEFGKEQWAEILMELEERRKELERVELPKCLQWVPNSVSYVSCVCKCEG